VAFLKALRPLDWIKNLFVLAPLLFSGQLLTAPLIQKSLVGFGLFCILSSGVYLLNDLLDREKDSHHPSKAFRAISAGHISVMTAGISSISFVLVGIAGAFILDVWFGSVAMVFLVFHLGYSFGLKNQVIVDVLMISAGFVLRVLAGATLLNIFPSAWIILCTVLLSLFLGFSKRRHELILLGGAAAKHRSVLAHYSIGFLDQMISAVLASTIVSYALYTINNGPYQIYSVFFVLYGMFRYLYLIHQRGEGGHAAESFFSDVPLLITVIGWGVFMIWDIYM